MSKIFLTDAEIRMANFLGTSVYRKRTDNNTPDHQRSNVRSGLQIMQLGFQAEIAACKYFNVYPDLNVYQSINKSPDYDLVVNNRKIDAKWQGDPEKDLLVTTNKKGKDIDIFLAVSGDAEDGFTIMGWARAVDVFKCPTVNYGKGDSHAYPNYLLQEPERLL